MNLDELQMNGSAVSSAALKELGEISSKFFHRGTNLCKRIQYITKVPTYYYLYRVAGKSLQEEQNRPCPSCGGEWKLKAPLFEIFDFKCDQCQLVSNLSWDFKK